MAGPLDARFLPSFSATPLCHDRTMIIPDHWAEARRQHRARGRQVTVRRLGWSLSSEADAQAMAERRAEEALQQILAGEPQARYERRAAYNGAAGVPIREEVLARHGEAVITRNAYGAHCLNTPSALFADIDFSDAPRGRYTLAVIALMTVVSVALGLLQGGRFGFVLWLLSLISAHAIVGWAQRLVVLARGGHEALAMRRIRRFLASRPAWCLRVYRTPGGLRLLATHAPFQASSAEVSDFFAAVGADPLYVRMCQHQQCFRARLTAKPWRIGISGHMRPRPGLWPVHPSRLPLRQQWVAAYEQAAAGFAACRFVTSLGSGVVHPELQAVLALHDREARADASELAIA